MNRVQLISAVSTETGYSKVHVEEFLSGFEKVVSSCLANDIEVTTGIGKFSTSQRAERQGRNPKTGETLTIAASKAPKFKPSKALKDAVN